MFAKKSFPRTRSGLVLVAALFIVSCTGIEPVAPSGQVGSATEADKIATIISISGASAPRSTACPLRTKTTSARGATG